MSIALINEIKNTLSIMIPENYKIYIDRGYTVEDIFKSIGINSFSLACCIIFVNEKVLS
jgi:hypothetical protein